jgi:hypothetical protein
LRICSWLGESGRVCGGPHRGNRGGGGGVTRSAAETAAISSPRSCRPVVVVLRRCVQVDDPLRFPPFRLDGGFLPLANLFVAGRIIRTGRRKRTAPRQPRRRRRRHSIRGRNSRDLLAAIPCGGASKSTIRCGFLRFALTGVFSPLRICSWLGAEEARNGEQAKVVGRRVVTAPHRHPRAPSPPPPSRLRYSASRARRSLEDMVLPSIRT